MRARHAARALPAWLVHLYTASSALLGLWACVAIARGELRLAYFLMMAAMAIDATDGALARWVRVGERTPRIDGRRLDDIVDFFTYVLVPALLIIAEGILPHPAWVAVPVLASGYGFAQVDAKTEDHYFLGFPSYWNVLAIYLAVLDLSPEFALGIVLAASAAVFVPLRYLYPSRAPVLRGPTLVVLGVWIVVFTFVVTLPRPPRSWVLATLFGPAYYLLGSWALNVPAVRERLAREAPGS